MKRPIEQPGVARREVERIGPARDDHDPRWDSVVVEEPLEIRVDGETVAVTMRTPGDDARLALGFLFAEGIIQSLADVGTVTHCGRPGEDGYGNVLDVRSGPGTSLDADRILDGKRWNTTSSACGVCGRRTIEDLVKRCGVVEGGAVLPASLVSRCVERLREVQPRFARTGGIHAAAAFDQTGELLCCHEDVGRHNAVDKTVGELLRFGLIGPSARPPALLVVSGRAGFEIVQKAAAARIPIVASVSASSSLAIDLAVSTGVTLAGFVRGESLNVYSHPWRIAGDGPRPRLRAVPTGSAASEEPTRAGERASAPEPEPDEVANWFPGERLAASDHAATRAAMSRPQEPLARPAPPLPPDPAPRFSLGATAGQPILIDDRDPARPERPIHRPHRRSWDKP